MEIVNILLKIIPLIFKFILWTYIWIPYLAVGLISVIMPHVKEDNYFAAGFAIVIMVGSIILWLVLLVQRIVRAVTKNPEFSFFKRNKEKKSKTALNPKADKKLVSNPGPEGGYPVGKQGSHWVKLLDSEIFHCFIVGGTGTGKSSTQVIPLLLCSKIPSVVVDIKGELAEKTAFARKGSLIFNPASPDSCGYDPFEFVTEDNYILDIKTIADSIIPVSPGAKNPFWEEAAQSYLAGCLLFCWLDHMDFIESMRLIQKTNAQAMVTAALSTEDEDIAVFLGQFDGMADDTLSGVQATVSSKIMVFASDPDLRRVLSRKRMAGHEMMSPSMLLGDNPRSIYLQLPEARLEVYRHATQLIIGQFCKYFEKLPDAPNHQPRANFVLDEFFRLGKLSSIQAAFATLRSKGVRLFAITQSLAQLEVIYEKAGARALADNFTVKVLLGATEPESQKYFSDLLGTYDKLVRSRSSNQQMTQIGGSTGVTISEQEKRLIRPEELGRLGNQCILFTPTGWTRVDKQSYYANKELLAIAQRAQAAPQQTTLNGQTIS